MEVFDLVVQVVVARAMEATVVMAMVAMVVAEPMLRNVTCEQGIGHHKVSKGSLSYHSPRLFHLLVESDFVSI